MLNRKIKDFVLLLLLAGGGRIAAQTVTTLAPQVIATSGGFDTITTPALGSISISYTIGEPVVTTVSTASPFSVKTLTQGFQQPDSVASTLTVSVSSSNSSCIGANNGSVVLNPVTSTGPVQYNWNYSGFSGTNMFLNLAPGIYHYQITDGNFTISDSVIVSEDAVDCGNQLVFYNGITPNGDGNNDLWVIDGITNFSENEVSIFNRWGTLVWQNKNYDNVQVVWDGKSNKTGMPLPDATYFYVINAGGKVYKGWIELTH